MASAVGSSDHEHAASAWMSLDARALARLVRHRRQPHRRRAVIASIGVVHGCRVCRLPVPQRRAVMTAAAVLVGLVHMMDNLALVELHGAAAKAGRGESTEAGDWGGSPRSSDEGL